MLLPFVLAALGALAGWCVFALARREDRTVLPAAWRGPMAAATGLLCGLLAPAREAAELPAFGLLAVLGVLLAAIDLRHKLLPNRVVLPFLGTAVALLLLPALTGSAWHPVLAGVLGSLAMFAAYLLAALVKPGGIGMGDVKLAAVVGLYAGYDGVAAWVAVLLGAFLLNAAAIVLLMLARVLRRDSDFPFGPSMITATLVVALAGPLAG
jgi:leader peptidase (prepilin peptidase)/N-methyltransferase